MMGIRKNKKSSTISIHDEFHSSQEEKRKNFFTRCILFLGSCCWLLNFCCTAEFFICHENARNSSLIFHSFVLRFVDSTWLCSFNEELTLNIFLPRSFKNQQRSNSKLFFIFEHFSLTFNVFQCDVNACNFRSRSHCRRNGTFLLLLHFPLAKW